jgi:glycine/D-amino acid oxidase-like deaminating enzyme
MPLMVDRITPTEDMPAKVDVVVIGGGIVGVCAALYAAKRGRSVALVEKGLIGAEQSSRNWGWVRQQNRDVSEIPMATHSLRMWEELQTETNEDLGFRRTGLVYVTRSQADVATWENWAKLAKPFDIDTRMLTAEQAREHSPGSVLPWVGGVYSPTDGRAEPRLACPALARLAMRLGVSVLENCAARGLDLTGGRVSGVVTERGLIRTNTVIAANGAWASMFLHHHGVSLPQATIRATTFRTTAMPGVTEGGLSTPEFTLRRRLDGGFTVGLSGRGRYEVAPRGMRYAREFWPLFKSRWDKMLLRAGSSFFNGPEAWSRWTDDQISPFEKLRILDTAPEASWVEKALAEIVTAYPALKGIQAAESWGGAIDWTPDGLPVIAPIAALPGLVLAAGFSGHGFGTGPASGHLAADLALGDAPIVDPVPFRHERLVDGTVAKAPGMI